MKTTTRDRWQAVSLAALLATLLSAGPASAAMLHDPALPTLSAFAHAASCEACWLSRVGTLFVRCDNLTGNAVQTPSRWPSADRRGHHYLAMNEHTPGGGGSPTLQAAHRNGVGRQGPKAP